MNKTIRYCGIFLLSCGWFGLFIGCASNKSISQNDIIGLSAENVPGGVRLSLDHIPPESNYVAFIFSTEGENPHSLSTEFYERHTLEEFKKTRTLVCPFVQSGLNYTVTAYVKKDSSYSNTFHKVTTEIIPDNGILFVPNGITLKLNESKTRATLSAFPELSDGVRYGIESKYTYLIHVEEDDLPVEGDFDSLAFDFSTSLDEVKAGSTLYNITPYRQLKYDNVTWLLNFCDPALFKPAL